MNFKKEYKTLKPVYPDIDKISKLSHFKVIWHRKIVSEIESKLIENASTNELTQKKSEVLSHKKEEAEQFFSVPEDMA